MVLRFYGINGRFGGFSSFSPHAFELDGRRWPTVEHYFQAQKFAATAYAEEIRRASTPAQAQQLGRSRLHPLRSDWEQAKDDIMYRAVLRKLETHAELRIHVQ